VMWQFAESIRGMRDACEALGTPVTGGNVSFYNESGDSAIDPTPVIGMLGLLSDHRLRVPSAFPSPGLAIYLLGETAAELGGSEFAEAVLGDIGAMPPGLDLTKERSLVDLLVAAAAVTLLASAHDCSDGGLAVALAECCMMHDAPVGAEKAPWIGAAVRVPFPARKDFVLFGEDASRIVVSLPNENVAKLEAIARACGAPLVPLGAVGGDRLEIQGALSVPVADLARAWRDGIPAVLRRDAGHAAAALLDAPRAG